MGKYSLICLYIVVILITLSGLFQQCEEGLDPVAGIEGVIHFPTDSLTNIAYFPDSLNGAVVVVADFDPNYSSVDSFFAHIVAYSATLDTSTEDASYYVQLKPGFYFVGVVGIQNISIAELLMTSQDSLVSHPEYFLPIGLYKANGSIYPITSIYVEDEDLLTDIDITVDYNLELPF